MRSKNERMKAIKFLTTIIMTMTIAFGFVSCKKDANPDVIMKFLYEIEKEDYKRAEWYLNHYNHIEKSSVRGMDGKVYAPAVFAAVRNDLQAMRLLLDYNVDLTKTDHLGATALFYAVQNQNNEMVKLILENEASIVNVSLSNGATPLSLSCNMQTTDISIIEQLLKYNADPNTLVYSNNGVSVSPLGDSVTYNRLDVIKLLLNNDADPFFLINDNHNAILLAIDYENIDVFKEFLDRGYSMTDGYPFNNTPIHIAAQINNIEILKLLIDSGVPLDIKDDKGRTPLQAAIDSQEMDSFEYDTVKYLERLASENNI